VVSIPTGFFPVLNTYTGADYDLQICGPGDLDPHAVASVLKAFLRERALLHRSAEAIK
jgi:hypothetical protein